jgi:RND family efflux transporter MFP subunit
MSENEKLAMLRALSGSEKPKASAPPPSPKSYKMWILVAVLALAAVAAWAFLGSGTPSGKNPPPAEAASTTTPAAPAVAATPAGLTATGYVVARRIATVAAEVTGTVTDVYIEEGNEVKAGDIVAKLDATVASTERNLAQAQLAQANATVRSLQAQLSEAYRVTARYKKLKATGAVSEARYTDAASRSESLNAQLAQSKSAVDAATQEVQRREDLLAKHILRAPFDGMVTSKNAQPGEIISPMSAGGGFTRTGICTIVDMNSLEVEVDVNEASISRVTPGSEAIAILDAYPNVRMPAYVIAIIPTANRDKATIKVRVGFKERDPRILPEMAARVVFL